MIVVIPISTFIFLRLFSAINTQQAFEQVYMRHFRNIYSDLHKELPEINSPTLIYMEGTTKDLDFAVGDASRVGELPTQAAFAVQYKTVMNNIIWPETIDDIGRLVDQNKLNPDTVHTFIYNGEKLIDTSFRIRDMLSNPNKYSKKVIVNKNSKTPFVLFLEQNNDNPMFYTSIPLNASLDVTNLENESVNLELQWKYDSYGPIDTSRSFELKLLKGESKKIKFTVSAGGIYLKELRIVSLDGKSANVRVGSMLFRASVN